jgi:hypothetical protein
MAESSKETRQAIEELNAYFHSGTLCGQVFYDQLAVLGIDCDKSWMVDVRSERDRHYCGSLIASNGKVYEFDVDLDDACASTWADVSTAAGAEYQRLRAVQPDARLAVALDLFFERNRFG